MSDKEEIRRAVRDRYADIAQSGAAQPSFCCGSQSSCCGPTTASEADISRAVGYSQEELANVPEGANLGLGCGNPQAIAALKPGEMVLDLGSGAGFDCFLAARQVGETGRVIGVDMTPEMLAKARANAAKAGYANVEFRLGEIEHLPVADATRGRDHLQLRHQPVARQAGGVREAFRVLKPGGRLAISDVVATAALPEEMKADMSLLSGCISGACEVDELEAMLRRAGFQDIRIQPKEESREFIRYWQPGSKVEDLVVSATIEAVKR